MTNKKPNIEQSWYLSLITQFEAPYFADLNSFLINEKTKSVIYPQEDKIYEAFNLTPFDSVKVVVLGQDPYHGKGQAHGLCFSVQDGVKPPPSLKNIFKEISSDLGFLQPSYGNLTSWAQQGVLMLNATLTVRANEPGSHQNKGWEVFTDYVVKLISETKTGVVFLLWGRYAQSKEILIDTSKHLVLKAAHPSPFSAHNGFFGCKHFSKTNSYLSSIGKGSIKWHIEDPNKLFP